MDQAIPTATHTEQTETDASLTRAEYAVRAKCTIKLGDVCTVYYPSHDDHATYVDHLAYHEQSARVIKLHEGTLDIQITSGTNDGEIIVQVNPMNLFFWGPFTSD